MTILTADDIDFDLYMRESEAQHKVKPASAWRDELIERHASHKVDTTPMLPWSDQVRFRPGEVTLWIGQNGHGKSLLVGQVILWLMAQGCKATIASFEMKPIKTLERMANQFIGYREHGIADIRRFTDWTDGRLWLYDQTGTVQAERVHAVIRHCADKLGCDQVLIDNLIKCVRSDEDYEGQKQFVDTLTSIARDLGVHIHLIHHPRKGADEFSPPRKMDARGAGAITDLVDNVMCVWRNKVKEEKKAKGQPVDDSPDQLLICDKQRNGDWEGRISLWWHHGATQYVGRGANSAMTFDGRRHG